jgi:stage IV sporulation protein FB
VFFEPAPTPYDLNFRLFGVHIRVQPWFWVMGAFLGWSILRSHGLAYLTLWIACVFVSVLVHEFGHVVAGWLFGSRGHIILYGMGGLAVGSTEVRHPWARILIYFAGPFAGLLLWGIVFLGDVFLVTENSPPFLQALTDYLFYINLVWSLLNLLPIWPLDGGRICREFLEWLLPDRGTTLALGISLVLAGLLAANALCIHLTKHALPVFDRIPLVRSFGSLYTAVLFGLLAYSSFQMLQLESQRRKWHDDHWDR